MRRYFPILGMLRNIKFRSRCRSAEQSLPKRSFFVGRREPLSFVGIDPNADVPKSFGTCPPIRNIRIVTARRLVPSTVAIDPVALGNSILSQIDRARINLPIYTFPVFGVMNPN